MIRRMFSGRWVIATLLILAAAAGMVRLGIWQLDRLKQRKSSNALIQAELSLPPLALNNNPNPAGFAGMEYRTAVVSGEYNFSEQVVLRNRSFQGQPGGDLLTPLSITGTQEAVLVDRGWIPLTDVMSGQVSQYNGPGVVTVQGILRFSQEVYPLGMVVDPTPGPGKDRLAMLNLVNLSRIDQQVSEKLLPVFIQENPSADWTRLPDRDPDQPDLSDGPHLSYAIQWFSFATIALVGYSLYVKSHINRGKGEQA